MRRVAMVSVVSIMAACSGQPEDPVSSVESLDEQHGSAPPHVFLQSGALRVRRSALMSLHGGDVLPTNVTHPIFWGAEWKSATFAGDKLSGLDKFFAGYGGSNFAGTCTEYSGSSGDFVTGTSSYPGYVIDGSSAPAGAISVGQAVAEVCKVTGNAPDANGVYFLFTSTGAGNVSYCAWHSWGSCSSGAPVQVAYMPNLDGVAGCDPGDTWTTHSEGLAALANVTSHELSEAITDPRGGGWYDSSGAEDGDKCAWAFHAPVTLKNGSQWKLQMEWSNAAYSTGSGYFNRSGQPGCLQGQ